LARLRVIDARRLVTVAEATTSIRGIAAEVDLDHGEAGLDRASVINCDALHTVATASPAAQAGSVGEETRQRVCAAISHALGC